MSMLDRHKAILTELAELGLSSARDLHQRQLAAETPEQAVRVAAALHRIGRSLRQTVALEAKLERDAKRGEREDVLEEAKQVVSLDKVRLARRRGQVQAAVERVAWNESETMDDFYTAKADLDELLDIEVQDDAFLAADPDLLIARLCKTLGYPSPLAGEGGPRRGSEEGSHNDRHCPSPADPANPEKPLIRPASAAHLLPQGEKDDDDPLFSDDYWRSSG
jgi:hypothetical protein